MAHPCRNVPRQGRPAERAYNGAMAQPARRLPINAPGPLFVDDSCIDCGTCWNLAPDTFASAVESARVARQPEGARERARAFMALVSCPTASIGTTEPRTAGEVKAAARALPDRIAPGLYSCGWASPDSYGAKSYLIAATPAGGGVLVDSPRAAAPLLARLSELGGVETLFLTHRDDVADHARLRARFGCTRVLHEADVGPGTREVERRLSGDEPARLRDDLLAIPVPGHTRGSTALLWEERVLFSGDHLWGEGAQLAASREVCWWSWPAQLRSLERLLEHRFEWVLPGHGDPLRAASPAAMRRELERLVSALRRSR